jgi:hypothetical protein
MPQGFTLLKACRYSRRLSSTLRSATVCWPVRYQGTLDSLMAILNPVTRDAANFTDRAERSGEWR